MAPSRNRRRKAGLMRIDAALAAMRPMGFSASVVRKHVRGLLKVYGDGDEGWYFIEEGSYKLLIDTILEDGASTSGEPGSLPMLCDKHDPDEQTTIKNGCLTEIDDKHKTQENDYQGNIGQAQPGPVPQLDLAPIAFSIIVDRQTTKGIRKPCYGWISDNDEDDAEDFILLPPANGANLS